MIITLASILLVSAEAAASPATPVAEAPTVKIEKQIVYQKEQTVDLTGTTVEGENQLPPAFFVTKMDTAKAKSLLQERLDFKLRDYNYMGF